MSVLAPHVFEAGDRVKATASLGWLKVDTVGMVTEIVPAGKSPWGFLLEDNVIVAWPQAALGERSADEEYGFVEHMESIDTDQFEGSVSLPMMPRELSFIDNLLKKD